MKTLQKYILSLLMVLSTVSMCAMDLHEHQTSSLQAIVARQGQAELEQASNLQHIVATRAPLKASKKLNLQSDILSVDLLKNEILEYLVGSSGRDQDKKPYFTFTIDRKVRPWLLIDQQRIAILKSIKPGDFEGLKKAYGLLDVYTLLFISKNAPKSNAPKSYDFIKNYKNELGQTPLCISAENGNVEVVRLLLDRGANVDPLNNYGQTSLYISAMNENIEVVRLLLDRGANVDTPDNYGWTPLYVSASNGNVEVVRLLLDCGANVDTPDKDGWTSLYISAMNGNIEVVRLLLDRGANVDTPDKDGWTPLYVSASNGNVEVVRLLLDRGANVDTPDKDGWTPLYVSAMTGRVEVVRLLLDRGANIDTLNNYGQTPEQTTSNPEIKALFAQARIDRAQKAALENQNKKDS